MRRYARTLVVIGVLVVTAGLALGFQTLKIGGFERGGDTPLGLTLGLDLQGGSDLRYKAALTDSEGQPVAPTADQMASLLRTIERRINNGGLGKPILQIMGDDRLLVQLPGIRDLRRAKTLIGETAQLVYKHRTLGVTQDIPGLTDEDILSASIVALDSVTLQPVTPSSPLSLSTATVSGPVATSSEASTLLASELSVPGSLQNATPTPALVLEFTESGAEAFGKVVDRLRDSLEAIPGTAEIDPETGETVPGTGTTYPNFLEISAAGTSSAVSIPYSPVVQLGPGQILAIGDQPYIEKVDGSNRFQVYLAGAFPDVEAAKAEYGEDPEIRLLEVLGRLDEDIGLTGDDMARAYQGQNQSTGLPVVNIEFNAEGTRKFAEITTLIAGTQDLLVIILDENELIAPSVQRPIIAGAAFIEGRDFTFERSRDIALLLESGRLPIPIELIRERDVDAILGADSLAKSVVAGLVGLGLVLLFMSLYYRVPGFVAALALMIYAALVLAIFKLAPVTLELSGVAAAILSIGMAVDANILIFERMKEELRAGRTLLSSINIGFDRAWPAIRDSNVSTLITCAILFWFADTLGATIVKSFAITLAIGVGMSMFSAITVSRTFLRLMASTPLSKRLGLFIPSGAAELPQLRPRAEAVQRS